MANEIKKVKIKSVNSNDKFFNVTGEDGIQYGIGREKSPKLSAILAAAKEGDEITGEYNEWNGKHYLSDVKDSSKGRTGAPRDKSFDAAISAWEGACQALSLDKEKSNDKILALAKEGYDFIMSKVTKSTGDSNSQNK